jgi:hypothetical protein
LKDGRLRWGHTSVKVVIILRRVRMSYEL